MITAGTPVSATCGPPPARGRIAVPAATLLILGVLATLRGPGHGAVPVTAPSRSPGGVPDTGEAGSSPSRSAFRVATAPGVPVDGRTKGDMSTMSVWGIGGTPAVIASLVTGAARRATVTIAGVR